MMGDPLADGLMIPVWRILESYGIKGDEKTAIYNRAYEAVMEAIAVVAALKAENAELRVYRDGYDTNEKLPKEGQKVLVVKNGEYSTYNFGMHLWRSLLAPDFERWWPLPKGGGG